MSEPEQYDELGAKIPAKSEARALAAEARELSKNPAFNEACRMLTAKYLAQYCGLELTDPTYERQCMRIQCAVNVIGGVVGQLAILADHKRFEDAMIAKTAKGSK